MNNYDYMDNIFVEDIRKMDSKILFSNKELCVVEVEDGIVYPRTSISQGGVCDRNNNYLKISKVDAYNPVDRIGGETNKENVSYECQENVIYLGEFKKQWGHFLIDCISRLWYILKDKDIDYKIVYTGDPIDGIYEDFLKLLNLDLNDFIHVMVATKFQKILIPECSHMPGLYYTQEWIDIFDFAINNAMIEYNKLFKGKHKNKIIYSRRNFIKKMRAPFEIGEEVIVDQFEKNGYEIVCPEEYSVIEQIGIIQNSKEIVSISGTLAHNLIFAKKGTRLIQLKKYPEVNYRQIEINQARQLEVINIDVSISPFFVRNGGPFVFDFNDNIIRFFNDYNLIIERKLKMRCFWLRKIYFFYYIFIYIFFTKILQFNREKPMLSFIKNESQFELYKKRMRRYYLKRFFK